MCVAESFTAQVNLLICRLTFSICTLRNRKVVLDFFAYGDCFYCAADCFTNCLDV